ncbi:hypothetical protein Tco_0312778 [Tanacetum coccineum]
MWDLNGDSYQRVPGVPLSLLFSYPPSGLMNGGGIGTEVPSRTRPLRVVMAFNSPLGLAMVLLVRFNRHGCDDEMWNATGSNGYFSGARLMIMGSHRALSSQPRPPTKILWQFFQSHVVELQQSRMEPKTLFEAIQARFGGNEATKKTQKTLLKQMYENFSENISQEDLNFKFLRSLPSEWSMHVVVWRNKPDLGTISFDDLYNNFKIVEQEVKRSVTSSSNSSSQNVAFVSTPGSTNEDNTANVQVSTASTNVSTASTNDSTASLSDATIYAFLANQPNGSQVVHEDLEQIHEVLILNDISDLM